MTVRCCGLQQANSCRCPRSGSGLRALQQQVMPQYQQFDTAQQQQLVAGCAAALTPRLRMVSFASLVMYVQGAIACDERPSLLPGGCTAVQAPRRSWLWRREPAASAPWRPSWACLVCWSCCSEWCEQLQHNGCVCWAGVYARLVCSKQLAWHVLTSFHSLA
jgi:hypothetical protein